jgi:S-adenosylmethionine-diacylglycerol 3-amino-3-carboxypropyl transferase
MAVAADSRSLLSTAVHHNRAASRSGVLERMFTLWFRGFVYNQIWEDPRVDAEALRLDSESRLLTISSGGCNVLNYLLHDPAKVVAVDLNTCHMALTRLKLTAIRNLPTYDDFFAFFGTGQGKDNLRNYEVYLRDELDPQTRRFWEGRTFQRVRVGRRRITYFTRGFYNHAKLGAFLGFAHRVARSIKRDPAQLLAAQTQEDQERFFDEVIAPFFDNRFVRFLSHMPVTVYSLGIPPSQHKVMQTESKGRIVELYRERVRKLACGFPMEDNYFAWQAFGRRYDLDDRRALPDYLREEHYPTLRSAVVRVETHVNSLAEYLRKQEPGALNRFVLLDSQDWMPPQVITELWSEIDRVGGPDTRIIFRTAGEVSPIEAALPPELMRRFVYEEKLSRELHAKDRSAIYGGFHVYAKRPESA